MLTKLGRSYPFFILGTTTSPQLSATVSLLLLCEDDASDTTDTR